MGSITKHLLFPVLLLFFSTSLPGQEKNADPDRRKISVGVHLGASISDIKTNQLAFPESQTKLNNFEKKRPLNERIGIQVLFHFGKSYALESGVFYEKYGIKTKGAYNSLTNTIHKGPNDRSRYVYEYFTVPILFKKSFLTEGSTQFSIHAGPYIGFLQSSNYSYQITVFLMNPDGSLFQSTQKKAVQTTSLTRTKDIGLRFRIGAEKSISELATFFVYGFFSKGLTHVEDFQPDNPAEISDGKHTAYGLTIGGYFRML